MVSFLEEMEIIKQKQTMNANPGIYNNPLLGQMLCEATFSLLHFSRYFKNKILLIIKTIFY